MDTRARITAGELVVVLSHYDLGPIDAVRRYRGGSRQSPKILLTTSGGAQGAGEFLLKRRGGSGDPVHGGMARTRVARSHQLHEFLVRMGFPLPELIRARDGCTIVELGAGTTAHPGPAGSVYELYRFVRGDKYRRSADQARAGGALLATFGDACDMDEMSADEPGGVSKARSWGGGGYHDRSEVAATLDAVRERIEDVRARSVCRSLLSTYMRAAEHAERLGVSSFPRVVIHADWHPGNMVFAGNGPGIQAVVDLDSVRTGQRVLDLANGALQFAIQRRVAESGSSQRTLENGGDGSNGEAGSPNGKVEPGKNWRIVLAPELIGAFVDGYRSVARQSPTREELLAIPWLMCEALIIEAVVPIAATGRFGRLDPLPLLALVDKTAASIAAEHERVVSMAGGQ